MSFPIGCPNNPNQKRIGKNYEEIYGLEKAKQIKEKINLARKGYITSEETKRKQSESKCKQIKYIVNENGCHICTSHKANKTTDYPSIMRHRKQETVQRYLYQKKYGEIPKGMVLRHTCDNRICINLNHLLIGTTQDNIRDKIERGRQPRGEKVGIFRLTEQQIIEIFISKEKNIDLAKKYDTHQSNIHYIKSGKTWGWLTKKVMIIEA